MENTSSLTALISCFGRVYHAERDSPLIFDDSAGRQLMTDDEYQRIKSHMLGGADFFAPGQKELMTAEEMLGWVIQTQIAPTPLARSRYCEDALMAAIDAGTAQYVILGAGMDTFAYRNTELMKRLQVFEVDHYLTQEDKKSRVARAGWEIPATLTYVPIDFTKDDVAERLLTHGLETGQKTFFSWLGVSYYLTKERIADTLSALYRCAAQGSTVVFDCADAGLFDSSVQRVRNMLAMAAAGGEPMKTCFEHRELETFLWQHGFTITELLRTQDVQSHFFSGRTDNLKAFEHVQSVSAARRD